MKSHNKASFNGIIVPIVTGGTIIYNILFGPDVYGQESKSKITFPSFTGIEMHDPVKRERIEKITIVPDSTIIKYLQKNNRTPAEEKILRDYLMQMPNSEIIPGRVIAVDPIKTLNPADNYVLNLGSENESYIQVFSADEMTSLLKKNKDKNRADNRILEQVVNSTYNKVLPDATKTLIEQAVADQYLLADEQFVIAKSLQQHGLDGVLVAFANKHDGGKYKGKNVKGETVPYFVYFSSNIPVEEKEKIVYKKKKGLERSQHKKTLGNNTRKIVSPKKPIEVSLMKGGGIHNDGRIIPYFSAGVTVDGFAWDIYFGSKTFEDRIPDMRWNGFNGSYTLLHDRNKESEKSIFGTEFYYGGDFKIGLGAEYVTVQDRLKEMFDEVLMDRNGNIDKERRNIALPEIKSDMDYFAGGPRISYAPCKYFEMNAGWNVATKKQKPSYMLGAHVKIPL